VLTASSCRAQQLRGETPVEYSSADITSHIPGLRRYASALLRNPVEAEDLVQECLCRAIARARPWRSIRDVRAYLFTILHNLYVDKIAKRSRTRDVVSDDLVEKKLVALPSQIGHLEIRDLGRALDQLSREQREVALLIGLEGLSYESAAHVLGIPTGTVMSRLHRAREALRKLMDGDGMAPRSEAKGANGRGAADDVRPLLRRRG
jgi:RNA polymerase sigma-70 factor (ECF subfamily)